MLISSSKSVIPLYRLIALSSTSSFFNILPEPPYPLTSAGAKALFYIFHVLPEIVVAWFIQSANVRALFNTGPWGDSQNIKSKGPPPRLRVEGVVVDGVGVENEKDGVEDESCRWRRLWKWRPDWRMGVKEAEGDATVV